MKYQLVTYLFVIFTNPTNNNCLLYLRSTPINFLKRINKLTFSSKLAFNMIGANCVVCLYGVKFDPYIFFSPIRRQCQHSKRNHALKPTHRISIPLLIFQLTLFSCILVLCCLRLRFVIELCDVQKTICMILISDETFTIEACVIAIMSALKVRPITKELQTWSEILESRTLFGLDNIFDLKKTKRVLCIKMFLILWCFFAITLLETLYLCGSGYDILPWGVPSKVASVFAVMVFFCIYVEFFLRTVIVGGILEAIKRTLKSSTQRNIKHFAKHAHIIRAIYLNHSRIVALVTAILITWIVANTVFLILNIYALLDYNAYDIFTSLILQNRTCGNLITTAILMHFHDQQLKNKVRFGDFYSS